ncbi:MAG TPA: hypothetical protein VLF91_05430 [Candidatus Saccharimonadales bacterium]|nr:hypothetical protein [Candidatus Saccharimonadales bacterium]
MDITGNRFGGEFAVDLATEERQTILEAIADVGIHGIEDDELRRDPRFGARVVFAVSSSDSWNRRTVEVAAATLEAPTDITDAKTLAARALLRSQLAAGLEKHPRC